MAATDLALPARWTRSKSNNGIGLPAAPGIATAYLTLIVLIPLAAVVWRATSDGTSGFFEAILQPQALAALRLTFIASLAACALNAVFGTILAWVLVRDDFPGKALINALIDLPFALPTIVAGLTLLALYGPHSPLGVHLAYTQAGVGLALLFVTLPFVVRNVQPVLMELDLEAEEAAASLGASQLTTFRRVILPSLMPALLSGVSLAFARSMGEFGSLVLMSGNIPFKTEVASVHIYGQIESGDVAGAAALSVVLLAVALVVLGLVALFQRRAARGS
ncbi:MAG TPA: sulfate ABC transporter permease subunit CysT [Candidatus Eremiobacteraceae bacterium]|nr:sulfate ABC transporter permease subunit CysT [Candidatus Eremiobacteraceae bacterium]